MAGADLQPRLEGGVALRPMAESDHTHPATERAMDETARGVDGLTEALQAIGDRWSPLIVAALLAGPARFGELQQRLPAIAPNVLSARLRALERRRLLVAQPYSQRPPRFLYELTATGRELAGSLRMLGDWGARHAGGDPMPATVHDACGTA